MFCAFTKLRYQVSVYMTIGSLVLDSIAAFDMKVGKCRQLIMQIKSCEYSRSISFLAFGLRSLKYQN